MMDLGWDPREGIFPSLRLIVSWLLTVAHRKLIVLCLQPFTFYVTNYA